MENIKISNFDEAIEHLTPIVNRVLCSYPPQDHDDISQTCWLKVFTAIKTDGPLDISYLVRSIVNTAITESRGLNNHGLTPRESKYKPPKKQYQIPDFAQNDLYMEFIRDLILDGTKSQNRVVEAAQMLLSVGKKPTRKAIAEMLGTTEDIVRTQLKHIRERYNNDDDQD